MHSSSSSENREGTDKEITDFEFGEPSSEFDDSETFKKEFTRTHTNSESRVVPASPNNDVLLNIQSSKRWSTRESKSPIIYETSRHADAVKQISFLFISRRWKKLVARETLIAMLENVKISHKAVEDELQILKKKER